MRIIFTILFSLLSLPSFAGVEQFILDNGLKILVKEDHRAPIAVSILWYNVGSADEPGGLTGVSHALEHMMFKGTEKYPMGVFSKTIASLGGQENAFTNYDFTAYYEKVPVEKLAISLKMEADRMQHLNFDAQEFSKEIKVIQEERRLRTDNNPQALTFERYLAAAHLADPYHHPVIGWMSDLQQMQINDVHAWYNGFYAPNNATLVVVGDVNPQKVYDLAKTYFSDIPKRPRFERKMQTEPNSFGPKLLQIHATAQLPLLMFGYTVPSLKTAKKEWEPYALELISGILDAGDNARFTKNLIRGSRLASATDIYYNLYARYQTQFVFFGTPSQNHNVTDLKAGILREIKRLQNEPMSDMELNRIKTQIIAQKTFEKDSIFAQAMELGMLETIGVGWQVADTYTKRINAITPAQIQEVAVRYFLDKTLTEAQLFPLMQAKGTL